jgi:hypothetical protein
MSHLPNPAVEDISALRNTTNRSELEIVPARVVRVTKEEMIAIFQNGHLNRMRPCVYNPASNTLKTIVQ